MDEITPPNSTESATRQYLEQPPNANNLHVTKLTIASAGKLANNDEAHEEELDCTFVLGYN